MFGQAGGAYDFRGVDHQQLKTKIVDLEKTQKTLKKKVNTKAAHMINELVWQHAMYFHHAKPSTVSRNVRPNFRRILRQS